MLYLELVEVRPSVASGATQCVAVVKRLIQNRSRHIRRAAIHEASAPYPKVQALVSDGLRLRLRGKRRIASIVTG
jgi:hypothetical protein